MANITLFSQIIQKLDRLSFNKIVKERQTDKHSKGFNSWTHLVSMLFCQFAKSQSVRDISNGLRSATGNLNHLGINKAPSKSTISNDFSLLNIWDSKEVFFVVRHKDNINFRSVKENPLPDNRHQHILIDEYEPFFDKGFDYTLPQGRILPFWR